MQAANADSSNRMGPAFWRTVLVAVVGVAAVGAADIEGPVVIPLDDSSLVKTVAQR